MTQAKNFNVSYRGLIRDFHPAYSLSVSKGFKGSIVTEVIKIITEKNKGRFIAQTKGGTGPIYTVLSPEEVRKKVYKAFKDLPKPNMEACSVVSSTARTIIPSKSSSLRGFEPLNPSRKTRTNEIGLAGVANEDLELRKMIHQLGCFPSSSNDVTPAFPRLDSSSSNEELQLNFLSPPILSTEGAVPDISAGEESSLAGDEEDNMGVSTYEAL